MAFNCLMSSDKFLLKQQVRLIGKEKYDIVNSQTQEKLFVVETAGMGHVRLNMVVKDREGKEVAFVSTPVIGSKQTVHIGTYDNKSSATEVGVLAKDRFSLKTRLRVQRGGTTIMKCVDESLIDIGFKDTTLFVNPDDKKDKYGSIYKKTIGGIKNALKEMYTNVDTYHIDFDSQKAFGTPEVRLLAFIAAATIDQRVHEEE